MPKYIDADKMRDNAIRIGFHSTTMTISEFINLQPTADVRPNVRGKWIDAWRSAMDGTRRWHRECSECGYERDDDNIDKDTNFCPNCGADMRQIGGEQE